MNQTEIAILSRLLEGPSTPSGLAKGLGLTPGRISQVLKGLLADGWVEVQRVKKQKRVGLSGAEHVHAFRELVLLHPGVKFEQLLAHGRFEVLSALIGRSPIIAEVVRLTGLSTPSVRTHLRALAAIGAVIRERRRYQINPGFRRLAEFLTAYWRTKNSRIVGTASGRATILWQRGAEFIARMPISENPLPSWQPAGITALGDAGIMLVTEFAEYFFSPYIRANPWHTPAHLLLAHPDDARYFAYALLYVEKTRLAEASFMEAARYYGAEDAVSALFKFRSTRSPVEGYPPPSWEEFVKLASDYGVKIATNFTASEIRMRLMEIGQHLKEPTAVYLIGGAAMALRGLKDATKDVDLVVPSSVQFERLSRTLLTLEYRPMGGSPAPALGASAIFSNGGGFRLDIYCQRVLRGLALTKSMQKRAEKFADFDGLQVFLVSNEDIFLFKSVTERLRDLDDMASLARSGLDWNAIYREAEEQSETSGTIWPAFLVVKLDELKATKGIAAPGLARFRGLAEKLVLRWLVAQKLERGLKTADEITEELGLPKGWVEKALESLKREHRSR